MILHRYFARRFTWSFAGTLGAFFALMILIDLVEQMRRFGSIAPFGDLVQLSLLNLPAALYTILPLIMVLATIAMFLGLARSSEMVVTRAAGRSALKALIAPMIVTLVIGAIAVGVFNPIVAATSKEFETRETELRSGGASVLAISDTGLWLRQGNDFSQTVIRADRSNLDGTQLQSVTFITFTPDGGPVRRIESAFATLTDGGWNLIDAKAWPLNEGIISEQFATTHQTLRIPSTLTADEIRDSFGEPSSIPIWELPAFIDRLEVAGFSATRHEVWLQMELALPAFLLAMVLIGSGFTMRHQRGGKTGVMVLIAVMLCFALFFLRNFAQILGENGQIPAVLAAWAPPLAAIGASLGLLLHLEDG
ncbi:LPS export ABC transporter permease LptG [Octadecabacter sp. 1_MG-2023]|uniref:LPS export ABC transporter permease LptG n=1 Tax=unclassified Octadecabacter TaxID=196158 RepID=UPI001C08AA74|nr:MULTISPECIES: LPS export ABC transporter permease LptG [unclassified Octadecabacter]MBU2993594.1 LPS export ABC transporter permease LptG [Octadecabacter sp. B2R22]MDO6735562.1 LPS export ABC transporter permease LptG [Octadecabacter sp. 1_MG-2023]